MHARLIHIQAKMEVMEIQTDGAFAAPIFLSLRQLHLKLDGEGPIDT